jgi:hypothetical protein
MQIIDLALDERINGYCVTAVCSYEWYVAATTGAETNLKIQRAIIKDSKAYQTLRADLRCGCILPPLVLAVSRVDLPPGLSATTIRDAGQAPGFISAIQSQLVNARPDDTFIVDGLQRTNALRQTLEELEGHPEEKAKFLARQLRIEVWLNIPFGAVAYRMLLLNAGQKPMSIKHQVEVLSMKLKDDLAAIPGIEILTSLSAQRRTRDGQFVLAKLAQAFQAWLQGSPHIDVKNTVMAQLLAESAIATLGTSLSGTIVHDDFKMLVKWFIEMDKALWLVDPQFFANETVLLGISAAVGSAQRNETLRDRMKKSLESLKVGTIADPTFLAVDQFYDLRQGEDVRKVNVGEFSREMIYRAFQEFFISDGTKSMKECWAFGASQA